MENQTSETARRLPRWLIGLLAIAGILLTALLLSRTAGPAAELRDGFLPILLATAAVIGVVGAIYLAGHTLLFLHSLLHELGHLIIGLLVGFRLCYFAVGRIGFRRTSRGLRRYSGPRGLAGLVQMVPRNARNALPKQFMFIAGGPMSDLLVVGALAYLTLTRAAGTVGLYAMLLYALCVSIYLLFSSIFPRTLSAYLGDRAVGYENDGLIIKNMLANRSTSEWNVVLGGVRGPWSEGFRARDWNAALLPWLHERAPSSFWRGYVRHLQAFHSYDCGLREKALEYMEEAGRDFVEVDEQEAETYREYFESIRTEVAFMRAVVSKNADRAEAILNDLSDEARAKPTRARAAIAALRGEEQLCLEIVRDYKTYLEETYEGWLDQDNMLAEFEYVEEVVQLARDHSPADTCS